MAGLINVNTSGIGPSKLLTKLSFQIGEQFLAKVIQNGEAKNNEILLKLLDGWQFAAKTSEESGLLQGNVARFQVTGFENGQLQLTIIKEKKDDNKGRTDSINAILDDINLGADEKDEAILNSLVDHSIPLTKENIEKAKTIIDFQEKASKGEEDDFIVKYLQNKSIDLESEDGKQYVKVLKNFVMEVKNLSFDDIATMMENNIDLNSENIKSFNSLMKDPQLIYKDITAIGEKLSSYSVPSDMAKDIDVKEVVNNQISTKKPLESVVSSGQQDKGAIIVDKDVIKPLFFDNQESSKQEISAKEVIQDLVSKIPVKEVIEEDKGKLNINNINKGEVKETKTVSAEIKTNNKDIEVDKEDLSSVKLVPEEIKRGAILKIGSEMVRSEIDSKVEQMKEIISELLKNSDNKQNLLEGALKDLPTQMNEFKVFNSLSSNYYYMALPINMADKNYDLKMIIKDDRKSGKQIDSKDIKLVTSVNTVNMDTVDAYISVKDNLMKIDIKADGKWISGLKRDGSNLKTMIETMGYNVKLDFGIRERPADIVSCRGFFDDNTLGRINVVV